MDVHGRDLRHAREGSQDLNSIADTGRDMLDAVEGARHRTVPIASKGSWAMCVRVLPHNLEHLKRR